MSTAIPVSCPNCSARMRVPGPEFLGKKVRCPKCAQTFTATQTAPAPAKSATAAASETANKPDDDEYGPPVLPLGDPRRQRKPQRETNPEPPKEEKPRKRRRRRKRSSGVGKPSALRMLGFGLLGGSVAAVVWIAVGYFARIQLNIIALLVGLCTGIGVQTGNTANDDHGAGEVAIGAAIVVILACRYIVACLVLEQWLGAEFFDLLTPRDFVWALIASFMAYRVASGGYFD